MKEPPTEAALSNGGLFHFNRFDLFVLAINFFYVSQQPNSRPSLLDESDHVLQHISPTADTAGAGNVGEPLCIDKLARRCGANVPIEQQ